MPDTKNMKGLIAAPFAPMEESGSLCCDRVSAYADFLKKNSIRGAFINGTNGEGFEMSIEERIALAETWIRHQSEDFTVIIHVGHEDTSISCELANHARNIGAGVLGVMMPLDSSDMKMDELHGRLRDVANAVPDLQVYYYHMPVRTGLNYSVYEILKNLNTDIANLVGVKYTDYNLLDYRMCMEMDDGRFDMVYGRDEMLFSALGMGAKAAIGSTYNFLAPLYHKIISAFDKGDHETGSHLQIKAMDLIHAFAGIENLSPVTAQKNIMGMLGIDCGQMRDPKLRMSSAQENLMKDRLTASGFLDFASKGG